MQSSNQLIDQDSLIDRDGTQIKFENRRDYDNFVKKLKVQLNSYMVDACLENNLSIDSGDAKAIESVLMDVFLKYTIEFMRENLLVEGQPIPTPPEFESTSSNRSKKLNVSENSTSRKGVKLNPKEDQPLTRPCDTALNERVIRQQYALYDAAVGNTRKRKDLPVHILKEVEMATKKATDELEENVRNVEELENQRLIHSEEDPRQRYRVINADLPNIERVQDNYSETNKMISNLMDNFPDLIENANRSIDLHREVSNVFYPSQQ